MINILYQYNFKQLSNIHPKILAFLKQNNFKLINCFKRENFEYIKEFDSEVIISHYIFKYKQNKKHKWGYFETKYNKIITDKDIIINIFKPTLDGFVYIIKSDLGYKIGKSKNIKSRANTFNVKMPFKWHFMYVFVLADYSFMETTLKKFFKEKNINGEWFNLTNKDLVVINKLIYNHQLKKHEKFISYSKDKVFL